MKFRFALGVAIAGIALFLQQIHLMVANNAILWAVLPSLVIIGLAGATIYSENIWTSLLGLFLATGFVSLFFVGRALPVEWPIAPDVGTLIFAGTIVVMMIGTVYSVLIGGLILVNLESGPRDLIGRMGKENYSKYLDYKIFMYGLIAIAILPISMAVLGVANDYFEGVELSAISAFGAILTGLVSILLIAIYREQTLILEHHGEILDNQNDLIELEYIPNISPTTSPEFDGDSVFLTLSNVAKGDAMNLKLITSIEFENTQSYSSPLRGESPLMRFIEGEAREAQNSLAAGLVEEFKTDAILAVEDRSGEHRPRDFHMVVDNLAAEGAGRIRVELKITAERQAGGKTVSCPAISEEYFYVNLEDVQQRTLESLYRNSTPG